MIPASSQKTAKLPQASISQVAPAYLATPPVQVDAKALIERTVCSGRVESTINSFQSTQPLPILPFFS